MTSIAQGSREPFFSTRTPYLPFVVLFGALVVIAVVVRLLNGTEEAATHPVSGAPVVPAEGAAAPAEPATRAASGSLSLMLPLAEDGAPLEVGPAAFPPNSAVVLSVALPTSQPTFVTVALERLAADGRLEAAQPISIRVQPDQEGLARVSTSAEELTAELGHGIYRVRLLWNDRAIGGTDVALGLFQPANVALFDEPRQVVFQAGEHVGVQVNRRGRVTEEKLFTLGAASGAPAAAYGHFYGTPHAYIIEGVWSGHWVPLGEAAYLE